MKHNKEKVAALLSFPSRLKVGYREITVEDWEAKTAVAAQRYGEYSPYEARIRVDKTLPKCKRLNTLLHEILHVIYDVWNINEKEAKEEDVVRALANGLSTVFTDNPDLVKLFYDSYVGKK